ncbi:MAG: sialate O-acetylesterase [Sphingobacteriales bacterium]|uniref:sialate O-acetylesterase n=1 Tax=Hydrotalea flava TaxID=714549 RepID=UPI0008354B6D|nr:sialate O-acetylesterase [Hydrotalea flava]RTL55921.1 MAG: sialate O-acetylesterase [Sphingobacteriales bacterium]
MKYLISIFSYFILCIHQPTLGNVTLPKLVGDSMILQRNVPVKIWGWATPGESIQLRMLSMKFKTVANQKGEWEILLPSMKAGGPYTMQINGHNQFILKDIYFGDIWLCAGQSNMAHQLGIHLYTYANEIKNDDFPLIRQFLVPENANLVDQNTNYQSGKWETATGNNLCQFSAVAYFFARKLFEKYHIPIGIINASVGGTPIEAWISATALQPFTSIHTLIQKNKDTAYINKIVNANNLANNSIQAMLANDKGITENIRWYDSNYVPKEWHNINVPGFWNDQSIPNVYGIVWYRKNISLPENFTGTPGQLALGRIVDADETYFNGVLVGKTGYQYPQRYYYLPPHLLKAGNNSIVVKITSLYGKGGFVTDKPYYISANNDTIDLKGNWLYKVGFALPSNQRITSNYFSISYQPTALYNGMIAPMINYRIKGVLWYQGESNTSNAEQYAQLLPTMIQDWRKQFLQNSLPFIYVQLPNYGPVENVPTESNWAMVREAQLKTLSVPNTGMVITIDLGEWNDIHPSKKKEVGIRAALSAEKIAYHDNNIVYSGPIFQKAEINGDSILLHFTQIGGGLISIDGEPLNCFEIAGVNKHFVKANAKIINNAIMVWNKKISKPVYVRYAWANNPRDANLYNVEGLPASPFRTDQ